MHHCKIFFVKIGRSVAHISQFFDISRWQLSPSCIFKVRNFMTRMGMED